MGYTKGVKWTEEMIIEKVLEVSNKNGGKCMPTSSQLLDYYGDYSLINQISKKYGFNRLAIKLGLKMSKSTTNLGFEYEMDIFEFIFSKLGLNAEKMDTKFPYDILVEDFIKIDVKCSNLVEGRSYYTFNLEKNKPKCDILICLGLGENKEILKTYIIPSFLMSGKKQLSVGLGNSKYDKYLDNWSLIDDYMELLNKIKSRD